MDTITSVSKGVFVFNNGFKPTTTKKLSSKNRKKISKKDIQTKIFHYDELWYKAYSIVWGKIEKKLENLNQTMFVKVLDDLIFFVRECSENRESVPTAALLTGINLPDHELLFKNLQNLIQTQITAHIAILYSDECSSLKSIIENTVYQIVNNSNETDLSDSSDEDDVSLKKSQCSFAALVEWYQNISTDEWVLHNSPRKKLKAMRRRKKIVIILPDFESLNPTILQDFIMIISSYLDKLPIILIFGVATSLDAIHQSLPHKASSKLTIEVFQSEKSISYLNRVLEEVFLNDTCQFFLTGKPFKLLTDVFLFYDFSVHGFIQGIKFALLEHFYGNNYMALCCTPTDMPIKNIFKNFTHQDYEDVRHLMSFRPYVERQKKADIIRLLEDDEFLKDCLLKKINSLSKYIFNFHTFLRCLYSLTSTLPKNPLGKQLREFYATAVSAPIYQTVEYKECFQMLQFSSKDELLENITKICNILMEADKKCQINSTDYDLIQNLKIFSVKIEKATLEKSQQDVTGTEVVFDAQLTRAELKTKLLDLSKKQKHQSEYEIVRNTFLEFIKEKFEKYLKPPQTQTFYEIFFFDDVYTLKTHVIGSPRAAIHTALNNPHFYLQCSCCETNVSTTILPTMPDLCIAYKLHLECGKLINMYDWLQAFIAILDPESHNGEQTRVSLELQARFTRAVAELQFLGFIKSSKRKTDHVQRLTWGGA